MATSNAFSNDSSGDRGDCMPANSPNIEQGTPRRCDDLTHSHDSSSLSDKSYSSAGSHSSYSDASDSRNAKNTQDSSSEDCSTQNKTKPQKKRVYHTMSTSGNKGILWRKPWKWKSSKPQHLHGAKNVVAERVSSAQLHKIKQLINELHSVQHMLEAANCENKLLVRLQKRHMKALERYESSENSVDQLIARHNSEVRALTESLRATKHNERSLAKSLKASESELLKTKDQLQRLQKLSEDKNLAERHELDKKLSALTMKLDIDDNKIKALEKQLHLMVSFYDRQLDLERKKLSEAKDATKTLQAKILALQKKIEEKEKELSIKNIYINRMPKQISKYENVTFRRGLTSTKTTQTVAEMFLLDQPNKQVGPQTGLPDKDNECETEKEREEENNSQITNEETLIEEVQQKGGNDNFLEIDTRKKEQFCGNESFGEELDAVFGKSNLVQQNATQQEHSPRDELTKVNKAEAGSCDKNQASSFIPRLRRNYKFTEATENLHHGLPATGRLLSFSISGRNLQGDSSVGYKPPFPKIEDNMESNEAKEEKLEKGSEVPLKDKKKKLMKELFGRQYNI